MILPLLEWNDGTFDENIYEKHFVDYLSNFIPSFPQESDWHQVNKTPFNCQLDISLTTQYTYNTNIPNQASMNK